MPKAPGRKRDLWRHRQAVLICNVSFGTVILWGWLETTIIAKLEGVP